MSGYDFAVIGCGVFGLSTALELSRRYPGKTIIAFDAFKIPSLWSAANDYNKIIRAEYSDIVYARLALEALQMWENDPLLKPHFVKSGRFTLSPSGSQNAKRAAYENKGVENLLKLGVDPGKISVITTNDELIKISPEFKDNKLFESGEPVEIKYNPDAGYGRAKNSLVSFYEAARSNGVTFKLGDEGKVTDLDEVNNVITTSSGETYKASKIVVAMGAATGFLINLQNQINSTGLFATHIQLNDEEFDKYKNMPIFFSAQDGYFFPPDPQTKKIKFAMTFCDLKNTTYNEKTKETSSLPRYKTEYAGDTFAAEKGLAQVKNTLALTLPDLANHPLIDSKTCWISDTIDSDFLIDFIPNSKTILVATGDSGHGYKFLGNIGRYIVDKLDNVLEDELNTKWKWRKNPVWPTDMNSRAKREHIEISEIKDWHVENLSGTKL